MDFSVKKEYFTQALADIRKVIAVSANIPVTAGIHLSANQDGLTLTGTNLELFIKRHIPLEINGERIVHINKIGTVVVPSKPFSEVVKKLPSDIAVQVGDHRYVTIQSEEITTNLNQLNTDDFPPFPSIDEGINVPMNRDDIIEAIKQTVFAVSKQQSRPALSGVHMTFHSKQLTCVATNSIRLALRILPIESDCQASCIVPSTTLAEFLKLSSSFQDQLEVSIADNHILFQSDHLTLYSRLISGNYPSTSGLIPKETSTELILDKRKLLLGIDRACLIGNNSKSNNVTIELMENKKLQISSNSSEIGQISETQPIKQMSGKDSLKISFDGQFMIDALKGIQDDEVTLGFDGSMRPILVKPAHDPYQLHLISPVRT